MKDTSKLLSYIYTPPKKKKTNKKPQNNNNKSARNRFVTQKSQNCNPLKIHVDSKYIVTMRK